MNFEHGRSTTVKIENGLIRGFRYNDVFHFYGIDYARAQRFMPPEDVPAWDGVKEAVNYGFICPPFRPDRIGNNLKNPHRFWPQAKHVRILMSGRNRFTAVRRNPLSSGFMAADF